MTEPTEKIATLQSEVKTLTEAVRELTTSMQRNNERLERLAVLEVSHRNSDHAIGRAFEALKAHEATAENRFLVNEKEHKSYDKAIWSSAGFTAAVIVFWTIFGIGMKSTIDDVVKTVAEMRAHVVQDKVMSDNDLYKFHKGAPTQ
jgi:uncharacterized protein YoxC